MKKLLVMIGFTGLFWATSLHAALEVINVTWRPLAPQNDLIDIDYEVVADNPDADVWVYPQVRTGERDIIPRSLTGDGAVASVRPGKHRITWNAATDAPACDLSDFSVTFFAVPDTRRYMVIDLSGGAKTEKFPISYLAAPPSGGWTDEYKGDRLVLRFIPPGTFMMGSHEDELGSFSDEMLHQVTLTHPFYIGVFQLTQKQWQDVMGAAPNVHYKGDFRPVERASSYNMLRGPACGALWPATAEVDTDSFFGVLRAKIGIAVDLPTEAQWEYACRAGTTTALNSGKNLTATLEYCPNMAEVGRYSGNAKDGKGGYSEHTTVGSYLPNDWGLYDMHGNISEWSLDWYGPYPSTPVTDPKGPPSGLNRAMRSGHYFGYAKDGRSASRSGHTPVDKVNAVVGFRVCAPLPSVR